MYNTKVTFEESILDKMETEHIHTAPDTIFVFFTRLEEISALWYWVHIFRTVFSIVITSLFFVVTNALQQQLVALHAADAPRRRHVRRLARDVRVDVVARAEGALARLPLLKAEDARQVHRERQHARVRAAALLEDVRLVDAGDARRRPTQVLHHRAQLRAAQHVHVAQHGLLRRTVAVGGDPSL